ncbi:MAG: hypothetical protein A2W61_02455 [Deltaproteobacteria bacterium RIFCSPLOWO2_01_44_7]|nr:MAG: hypothetical protein A2712_00725 [Deltaproteobacteria bacterium RIFCSPHIGHO2_01_FULL_43_49]OGQ14202.1 MAG: hypothetical protein A3D22_09885 [Deltaproteobacteria bacterium RIFCSPHIGHO2_02_FULL_44_53]OGQ27418.1 MAG: hypothetical protein A3D98_03485 [Deltaproteobacteria bacterium RIFCSPHIGHO2_12_FULL_44_21]OGQ30666.1 MAG: hypothetical protein A2979_05910 [Deltaproteobacteria bacterium RIFCSPLOWO2_01_FULL_45_74]OGQ39454.1 MAG: hypothetical protein A2W61_02455 [Deltaproteobacteria bacterium 
MKEVYFTTHVRKRLNERHVTPKEIITVLKKSKWTLVKENRMRAQFTFPFSDFYKSRFFRWKKIRVIFIEEKARIVIVTVYTFFYNQEAL